ncbi:MAG: hypothetical protein IPG28_12310 [Betaproteobacteria bacterium]|nr:hypothetical protein [Betaproteobacteria bacterium]
MFPAASELKPSDSAMQGHSVTASDLSEAIERAKQEPNFVEMFEVWFSVL